MGGVTSRPGSSKTRQAYWERVYAGKDVDEVSWWQQEPDLSLGLVDRTLLTHDQPVIDVGAGWSTLVDHLRARGFSDLTAVDLSPTALQTVRLRLGAAAADLRLLAADVLDLQSERTYALWHDRAVFHFLTEAAERARYRASLERSLRPHGWVVMATFGPEGPSTCSGLPVVRYSHDELAAEFPGFDLVARASEDHTTPWGATQQFVAVLLRRKNGTAPTTPD